MGAQMSPLERFTLVEAREQTNIVKHLPCMPNYESHLLSRNVFCGNDKVSLIFAIGRVKHYDEFTVPEGTDGILNAIEVELRLSVG